MQGGIPTLPVLHTSPSQVKPPHFVRFPSPLLIYTSKCLTQEIHAMTVASAQSTVVGHLPTNRKLHQVSCLYVKTKNFDIRDLKSLVSVFFSSKTLC